MKITCCNQKGGVGKSTLVVLLAMVFESIGKSVAIVDNDPQNTTTHVFTHLKEIERSNIDVIDDVSQSYKYDVVFIDTPPTLSEVVVEAIQSSDRIILVCTPSPADLWSTKETVAFLEEHNVNDVPARLLFNSVLKAAKISRDLTTLSERIGMDALGNAIVRRQDYQYAFVQGWPALDKTKRDELKSVALEIATL